MSPIVLAARWRATSPKEDLEAYPFDAMGVSRTTFPRRHLHYRMRDLRGASVISLRATPINCSMACPAASVPAHPDRFKHIPMLEDRLLMRLADLGRQPDPSWDLMPEIRLIVVGGTPQAAFAPDLFLVLVVVPRPLYLAAACVGTPPCTHVVRRAAAAVAGSCHARSGASARCHSILPRISSGPPALVIPLVGEANDTPDQTRRSFLLLSPAMIFSSPQY